MVRRRSASGGYTLIELLVTVAIIGALLAILLSAVQALRATVSRLRCANHQRQLVLAMYAFHGNQGRFPVGDISTEAAVRARGKDAVARTYWFEMKDYFEQTLNRGDAHAELLICPSRGPRAHPACDYAGFTPYWYTETTGGELRLEGDPPTWKKSPFKATIGIFARSVLGGPEPVTLTDIASGDGAASTAVFTDKSVDRSLSADQSNDHDIDWQLPGRESLFVDKYRWSAEDGQYVLDRPPLYFGANVRRWSIMRRGMGSATFFPDRRGTAIAGFGSAHLGSAQPVTFADGSVRDRRYLVAGSISFDDGWIVERGRANGAVSDHDD